MTNKNVLTRNAPDTDTHLQFMLKWDLLFEHNLCSIYVMLSSICSFWCTIWKSHIYTVYIHIWCHTLSLEVIYSFLTYSIFTLPIISISFISFIMKTFIWKTTILLEFGILLFYKNNKISLKYQNLHTTNNFDCQMT